MSDVAVPREWEELWPSLASGPRCCLVVGATDVGKSTLCRWLVERWAAEGTEARLVDADVGQSQLGPPGSVGCGRVEGGRLVLESAFFVGDVSPGVCPAAALGALAAAVRAAGGVRIVVDTTGWVLGPEAVALKLAKGNLLGSAHIVPIEAAHELRAFRRAWRGLPSFPLHELRPSPAVRRRSVVDRRAFREAAFRAALEGAIECEVDLREVAVSGAKEFETPLPALPPGLLLGFSDERGRLLCLGVLLRLEAHGARMTCLTRPEGAGAAEVRVGRMFLNPDGTHSAPSA